MGATSGDGSQLPARVAKTARVAKVAKTAKVAKLAKYDAITIAKWLAAWAEAEEADLSNLKLQNLLFYAQGHHLARYDAPLFHDKTRARADGPIIPSVYDKFKTSGTGDVQLPASDPFKWSQVDHETSQFLVWVWNSYAGFADWRLRNMTQNELPWIVSFGPSSSDDEITESSLEKHFKALLESHPRFDRV